MTRLIDAMQFTVSPLSRGDASLHLYDDGMITLQLSVYWYHDDDFNTEVEYAISNKVRSGAMTPGEIHQLVNETARIITLMRKTLVMHRPVYITGDDDFIVSALAEWCVCEDYKQRFNEDIIPFMGLDVSCCTAAL
jgi:hypothetical protein